MGIFAVIRMWHVLIIVKGIIEAFDFCFHSEISECGCVITLYNDLLQEHANFNIAPKTLLFMEAKKSTSP